MEARTISPSAKVASARDARVRSTERRPQAQRYRQRYRQRDRQQRREAQLGAEIGGKVTPIMTNRNAKIELASRDRQKGGIGETILIASRTSTPST
jgi:hypothetical protein